MVPVGDYNVIFTGGLKDKTTPKPGKVAWPRWPEVRRYAIIVLVTVVIITAYVGGLDAVFGILSGWLYKD